MRSDLPIEISPFGGGSLRISSLQGHDDAGQRILDAAVASEESVEERRRSIVRVRGHWWPRLMGEQS